MRLFYYYCIGTNVNGLPYMARIYLFQKRGQCWLQSGTNLGNFKIIFSIFWLGD